MQRPRVIFVLFVFLMLAFGALMARCVYLQVYQHDYYQGKCIKQQRGLSSRQSQRGVILDARGRILAASNQIRTICADPGLIKDARQASIALSEAIDTQAHEIYEKIVESKTPRFVKLYSNASWEQSKKARQIPGVIIQYEWQRYYPFNNLCAHLVGFVSRDSIGLGGVEYQYNSILKGEPAEMQFLMDQRRRPIRLLAQTQNSIKPGRPGQGVILTIDSTIQQFVRDELKAQIKEFEAKAGIAVVAEPKTGAILAMVSLPDFDPTKPGTVPDDIKRNRVLVDMYEPGSIMKPIVAAIALDNGTVTKSKKIYCENGLYSGKYKGKSFGTIHEYEDHKFKELTVKEILIHSSNIGMAKLGQWMGPEKLYKGLVLFGFGSPTGITLPGEASGQMFDASHMKKDAYTLARVPYGHGISVTGMQMLRAFCVLANGGHLVRPHIIKSFVDEKGNPIIRDSAYKVAGDVGVIIGPDLAHWMVNDALSAVVNTDKGTGRRARLERWRVFGKTGTAKIPNKDRRGYEEGAYVSSFIAGAPAEDPALVVLVSIHRPNKRLGKGYSGGPVASPVVGRILERSLTYMESKGLIPSPPMSSSQDENDL